MAFFSFYILRNTPDNKTALDAEKQKDKPAILVNKIQLIRCRHRGKNKDTAAPWKNLGLFTHRRGLLLLQTRPEARDRLLTNPVFVTENPVHGTRQAAATR
jgi:hypothetical protein